MADTTYIAIDHIEVAPGVRAFSKGETVPVSVVENLKAHDKVVSDRTKAAKEAVAADRTEVTPSASPTNQN